jgi:uncharacterized protein YdeI (BOF family)
MQSVIRMNKQFICKVTAMIFFAWGCASGLKPDIMHSLSEIKRHARHGQEVKSQGILTEKTGEREFLISDDHVTMKINLNAYKKESKFLEKNSKIVFSGTYRKKLLTEPEIEVKYLKVVEEFR